MINEVDATGITPSLATGTVPSLGILYGRHGVKYSLKLCDLASLIFLLYVFAFSLKLALRVKRVCEDVYVHTYF